MTPLLRSLSPDSELVHTVFGLRHWNCVMTLYWKARKSIPGGVLITRLALEWAKVADGRSKFIKFVEYYGIKPSVNRLRKLFWCSATFPWSTVGTEGACSILLHPDQLINWSSNRVFESKSLRIEDSDGIMTDWVSFDFFCDVLPLFWSNTNQLSW